MWGAGYVFPAPTGRSDAEARNSPAVESAQPVIEKLMPFRFVVFAVLAVSLSACQTSRGTREPVWPYPDAPSAPPPGSEPQTGPQTSPGSDLPTSEPILLPMPESRPPLPDYPKTAEAISGGAVVSLFKQARAALDMGKPEQAQAALERALRIEPRNYFVWSAMASAYLEQKNYPQAMTVAKKSNSLARGNVYVEMENFRVIAAAKEATGDAAGALQAQARVEEIQRLLQGSAPN